MQAVLADAGIAAARVDEVILANALGAGGNPARRAGLLAGLPERVAGLTIDRQCAGGLDAVLLAQAMVDSGAAEVVLAGGAESYSRRPLRAMPGVDGVAVPYDQAPFTPWPDRDPEMGAAAAALAERLGISREAQAAWAVESHAKAVGVADWPEIVAINGVSRDAFTRALTSSRRPRLRWRRMQRPLCWWCQIGWPPGRVCGSWPGPLWAGTPKNRGWCQSQRLARP
jgi:acetyl-CoA C-acetyltransferase